MPRQAIEFVISAQDKASKSLNKMQRNFKKSFADTAQQARAAGLAFGAMGAAAGLAVKSSIAQAIDFQKSMSNVSTLINTTEESVKKMGEEVLKVAERTPVAIGDLTTALYDVRSAGIDSANAMTVLEESARLGIAGLGSAQESVNLLTSAMNAYGFEGNEAKKASDILFKTVKAGKTTVSELTQSFGLVAGIAKSSGVSFEELQAATAALTVTGQKASVAQTQLKTAILAINAPNKKMLKGLRKAGFASGKAAIANLGLVGTMQVLKQSTGGNTAKLKEMFGSVEALGGVISLTGEQNVAFTSTLDSMKNSINEVDKAFEKQCEAVAHQWQLIKNNLNVVMIESGSEVLPILAEAIKGVTGWIQKLSPEMKSTIAKATLGVAVFGTLAGALLLFVSILPMIVTGFTAVITILSLVFTPIGLLVVGIGILAAAWKTNLWGMKTTLNAVYRVYIKPILSVLKKWSEKFLPVALDYLNKKVKECLKQMWDVFRFIVECIIESVIFLRDTTKKLLELWEKDWSEIFTDIWETIKTIFGKITKWAEDLAIEAVQWGINLVKSLAEGMKKVAMYPVEQAQKIANDISDYLGFSSPTKKGPGALADTWGPNLMKMFAKGLSLKSPEVIEEIQNMMEEIQDIVTESSHYMFDSQQNYLNKLKEHKDMIRNLSDEYRIMKNELLKNFDEIQSKIKKVEIKKIELKETTNENIAREIIKQKKLIADLEKQSTEGGGMGVIEQLEKEKKAFDKYSLFRISLAKEIQEQEIFNAKTLFEQMIIRIEEEKEKESEILKKQKIELEEKMKNIKKQFKDEQAFHFLHLKEIRNQRLKDVDNYKAYLKLRQNALERHLSKIKRLESMVMPPTVIDSGSGRTADTPLPLNRSPNISNNPHININFGNVSIKDGQDMTSFEERVTQAVSSALRKSNLGIPT